MNGIVYRTPTAITQINNFTAKFRPIITASKYICPRARDNVNVYLAVQLS